MTPLDKGMNKGDRPNRLELGRLWSGELREEEAERLRTQIADDPAAQAYLATLERAREQVAPFDAEILRKRAFRTQEEDARQAESQQRREVQPRRAGAWWRRWLPASAALAAAAVALLVVLPPQSTRERHVTPYTAQGTKGEGSIEFYVLRDDQVHPGSEDETHWAGDSIQFTYRTQGESTLVILSLDGRGELNLYYPSAGDAPVPVVPGERKVLEGSIVLDDAPDFELVLAYFGHARVEAVLNEVRAVYDEEGVEGLLLLAEDYPDVDAIYLRKGEPTPRGEP